MKLLKKLSVVTLAVLALGTGAASANVIEHVKLGLASGATFEGKLTFADQYTALLAVDGYLAGSIYGNDYMGFTFDAHYRGTPDDASYATGLQGVLTDFLLDGDPDTGPYYNYLGISWMGSANSLSFDLDAAVNTDYAGVNASDRIVSATVGDPSAPSKVPEPASMVLLGLGLAGLAAARRRKG